MTIEKIKKLEKKKKECELRIDKIRNSICKSRYLEEKEEEKIDSIINEIEKEKLKEFKKKNLNIKQFIKERKNKILLHPKKEPTLLILRGFREDDFIIDVINIFEGTTQLVKRASLNIASNMDKIKKSKEITRLEMEKILQNSNKKIMEDFIKKK